MLGDPGLLEADLVGDEESLDRQLVAGRDRQRTRSDKADIDGAAGDGRDDVGARIELAPVEGAAESKTTGSTSRKAGALAAGLALAALVTLPFAAF